MLMRKCEDESKQQLELFMAMTRLIDAQVEDDDGVVTPGMGESYKAMAIIAAIPGQSLRPAEHEAGFPNELHTNQTVDIESIFGLKNFGTKNFPVK